MTPNLKLRWHTRVIAIAFVVLATAMVLVTVGISQADPDQGAKPIIVGTICAVPFVVAAIGILRLAPWGRLLGLILSEPALLLIPVGTAVGIYAIIFLNKAKDLFSSRSGGEFNLTVKSGLIDGKPPTDWPFETLKVRSMYDLEAAMSAHNGVWKIGQANWSADQAAGTITFEMPDGSSGTSPMQIIGTYNPKDGTWLWAWDHPSMLPRMTEHARVVREYGRRHGVPLLTTRKVECTEKEAWEFAAIARTLNNAAGAWRAPTEGPIVFMTFGNVKFSKA